jgi:phage I-like protein
VAEYGYLVDLHGVQLQDIGDPADDAQASWIQAAPLGPFNHPVHGKIEFTAERVKRFADNVKNKVRGQDLNIDYDHREGEAAGWVKDAEARADGLWLLVEWTKKAAEQIRNKAYRYFSPDFFDEWTNPSTNQKYTDVLCGGGLTNRPFLKGILPVNLSEAFASQDDPHEGALSTKLQEVGVDPKKLRKLLGLKEDATDADVTTALTDKGLTVDDFKVEPPKADPPKDDDKSKDEPVQIAASEILELAKKLSEGAGDNAQQKQLADLVGAMATSMKAVETKLETTEAALKLSEATSRVVKLNEGGAGKRALPPAVTDKLRDVLVGAPKQLSDTVYTMFEDVLKTGLVELGERGSSRTNNKEGDDKTALVTLKERTDKLMAENKGMNYADACEKVFSDDPQLFETYREESTSFVEN